MRDKSVYVTRSPAVSNDDAHHNNGSMYEEADDIAARMCWRRVQRGLLSGGGVVLLLLCLIALRTRMPGYVGVVEYSFAYFVLCFVAGALAGLTHLVTLPLDLIKCRMQVGNYRNLRDGVRSIYMVDGHACVWRALPHYFSGWLPTLVGYTLQGGLKFALYELFKYTLLLRHTAAAATTAAASVTHRSPLLVFLVASFCAELLADVALAPWEAIKIRMQTASPAGRLPLHTLVPHMWLHEGVGAFYKALVPLWCRQVPATMVKFATFEKCVLLLHGVLQFVWSYLGLDATPASPTTTTTTTTAPTAAAARVNYSVSSSARHTQAAVLPPVHRSPAHTSDAMEVCLSLLAGALSGVLCAVVSHPADTLLSRLNQRSSGSSHVGNTRSSNNSASGSSGGGSSSVVLVAAAEAVTRPVATHNKNDSASAVAVNVTQNNGHNSGSSSTHHTRDAALTSMARQVGWRGLWKGILPRICMVSLLTALQWIMYDGFKMLVGLPGTGRTKST